MELNNREEAGLLLSAVVLFIAEQLKVHRTLQHAITPCSKVDFISLFWLLVLSVSSSCCVALLGWEVNGEKLPLHDKILFCHWGT